MTCDGRYDSHDWVARAGRRVCAACGLVDLGAERLRRLVLVELGRRGWRIKR